LSASPSVSPLRGTAPELVVTMDRAEIGGETATMGASEGTVLVVEDDNEIRGMIVAALDDE
jgi:hypothetical protein